MAAMAAILDFSDRHYFSYFWSTSHPDASYQVWSELAFSVQEKKRIDFQDDGHGGHSSSPWALRAQVS